MKPGLDWVRRNFRIKAGLFLLAVMLWFLVVSTRTYEQIIEIPIEILGLRMSKVIVTKIPTHAEVKVHATGREFVRMRFVNKPVLQLDITTIRHYYTFQLIPEMVFIPGGLNAVPLDVITPDSIKIVLQTKKEMMITVSPVVKVTPEAGYTFGGEVHSTPEQVSVTGPAGQIEKVEYVKTETFELKGLKRTMDIELALIPPLEYGTTMSPKKVRVTIPMERIGERNVKGVIIGAYNAPSGRDILIDPVSVDVVLSGGISKLADLKADDLVAWVDYLEYNLDTGGRVAVHIRQPESIDIKLITPEQAIIVVRRK